jgi:hypothetical protein
MEEYLAGFEYAHMPCFSIKQYYLRSIATVLAEIFIK